MRPRGLPSLEDVYNEAVLRDPSLIPLSHQHQHGLALCVLIDRGLVADATEVKAAELHEKLAALVEVELLHHFEVEEEVLFPAVRAVIDSPQLVDELITQHREMEELARRIEQTSGADRVALLQEFGELLSGHIRTEERRLFQEIQAKLTPEQLEEIGRKIDQTLRKVCPATGRLPWEHPKEA